jgi:hypothetical protein
MPPEIRAALLLWLTALVAVEAGVGLVAGRSAVRLIGFVAALYVVVQMSLGRRWARLALAAAAAVLTPWLAVASMWWLSGDSVAYPWLAGFPAASGAVSVLFAASVVAHVAAATAAVVYMFRPAANRYFRAGARVSLARGAGRLGS